MTFWEHMFCGTEERTVSYKWGKKGIASNLSNCIAWLFVLVVVGLVCKSFINLFEIKKFSLPPVCSITSAHYMQFPEANPTAKYKIRNSNLEWSGSSRCIELYFTYLYLRTIGALGAALKCILCFLMCCATFSAWSQTT